MRRGRSSKKAGASARLMPPFTGIPSHRPYCFLAARAWHPGALLFWHRQLVSARRLAESAAGIIKLQTPRRRPGVPRHQAETACSSHAASS